jgi:hypothetical protein
VREPAGWVLAGGWAVLNLLLAAGVVPNLDEDTLASTLVLVPGLAFLTVTLLRPRPKRPARLLWSGPWTSGTSSASAFVRPYLPGWASATACIAGTYLGAVISLLRGSSDGGGHLLTTHYVDWTFFAVVGLTTTGLVFVVVLAVVLPLGAAMDARRAWDTDRLEARGLLAFTAAGLGLIASLVALVLADPQQAERDEGLLTDRWDSGARALRTIVSLLVAPTTSPLAASSVWAARLAVALLLASLALYWTPPRRKAASTGPSCAGERGWHGG